MAPPYGPGYLSRFLQDATIRAGDVSALQPSAGAVALRYRFHGTFFVTGRMGAEGVAGNGSGYSCVQGWGAFLEHGRSTMFRGLSRKRNAPFANVIPAATSKSVRGLRRFTQRCFASFPAAICEMAPVIYVDKNSAQTE